MVSSLSMSPSASSWPKRNRISSYACNPFVFGSLLKLRQNIGYQVCPSENPLRITPRSLSADIHRSDQHDAEGRNPLAGIVLHRLPMFGPESHPKPAKTSPNRHYLLAAKVGVYGCAFDHILWRWILWSRQTNRTMQRCTIEADEVAPAACRKNTLVLSCDLQKNT